MSEHPTRRRFLQTSAALGAAAMLSITRRSRADAAAPIDIGSRRELLVDDFLIEHLRGAELTLHYPEAREVVLVCDRPWEGNTSGYYTFFEDEGLFKVYYRGAHHAEATGKSSHPLVTCYAQSRDGLTWERPDLGLIEFAGSKQNNIVWTGMGSECFTPFKDTNPDCPPDARYKAFGSSGWFMVKGKKTAVLHAFKSPDGLRWSAVQKDPVITDGNFDSQNLAFWDSQRSEYRAYWRYVADRTRRIRTGTSRDFIHWVHHADLTYGDAPDEQLYTNAVRPYFRAPHLFIGFPTRFQPKHEQVEPVFMTSRDGAAFRRWPKPLIPITAPKDRDGNRCNYMTNGLLQLPGNDRELSVYATEAYYAGPGSRVRRFVYRMDGFVSASTGAAGGELLTRPILFTGSKLSLNIASRGPTRLELRDAAGQPLPGFSFTDCAPITADAIDHTVAWNGGSLAPLTGRPVRLAADLKAADLYALQFHA